MGSRLTPLNATERSSVSPLLLSVGKKEEEFDFDFHEAVKTRRDWRNAICNTFIREHADAAGRFDGKTMEMDGRFIRVLFIRKFPNSVNDEFIKMLTSVSYHTVITLDIAPIPQEVATKRLFLLDTSTERSIEKQQEQRNRARAYSSDISYEKRKRKEEIESYLDLMNDNDERLFYLGGYVVDFRRFDGRAGGECSVPDDYGSKLQCGAGTSMVSTKGGTRYGTSNRM